MSRRSNRRLSRLEKLAASVMAERKRRSAAEAAWQAPSRPPLGKYVGLTPAVYFPIHS